MENKTFMTPGGYACTIKADISFGDYEDIQNVMINSVKIDPETGKPTEMDMSSIKASDLKARELLIVSIVKDGVPVENDIRKLPRKDGIAIKTEIDAILNSAREDDNSEDAKKKATT